jgi:hypothetical protein
MTNLRKIFDDYEVIIEGKGQFGRYDQLFKLTRKPDTQITLDLLQKYVTQLQQKHPQRGFRLKKRGKFHIIDQTLYREDGKRKQDRIPIYFNIETQEIFVPDSYIERKPRLANYILTRTLGALGIAKVKYYKTLAKAIEGERA